MTAAQTLGDSTFCTTTCSQPYTQLQHCEDNRNVQPGGNATAEQCTTSACLVCGSCLRRRSNSVGSSGSGSCAPHSFDPTVIVMRRRCHCSVCHSCPRKHERKVAAVDLALPPDIGRSVTPKDQGLLSARSARISSWRLAYPSQSFFAHIDSARIYLSLAALHLTDRHPAIP